MMPETRFLPRFRHYLLARGLEFLTLRWGPIIDYFSYLFLEKNRSFNNISIIYLNSFPLTLYDGQLRTSFGVFHYGATVAFVNN